MQNSQQTWLQTATFESCGARKTTGDQYIEQEKHKLDHKAARNIRMSLDIHIAFLK